MQKLGFATLCLALALLPAHADQKLSPGKPAGVHAAQTGDMIGVYGGVLAFAALLFGIMGTSGDPPSSATSTS